MVLKADSSYDKKLQEVEAVLEKLGITISRGHRGLEISFEKEGRKTYFEVIDQDGGEVSQEIPRKMSSERLVVSDG